MKKLLSGAIAATCLLGTTVAFAGGVEPPVAPSFNNDFSIGIGLGAEALNTQVVTRGAWDDNITSGAEDLMGRIYGNYTYVFGNRFNLGGEVYFQYENISSAFVPELTVGGISVGSSLDLRYRYGIKLMPGYDIANNVRMFLAVGADWAKMRYNFSDVAQRFSGAPANTETTKPGLLLGTGLDVALPHSLSLRAEYDHINNQVWTIDQGSGRFAQNANFKSTANEFLLAVAYHFMT